MQQIFVILGLVTSYQLNRLVRSSAIMTPHMASTASTTSSQTRGVMTMKPGFAACQNVNGDRGTAGITRVENVIARISECQLTNISALKERQLR